MPSPRSDRDPAIPATDPAVVPTHPAGGVPVRSGAWGLRALLDHSAVRYLLVGSLSFVVDLGVLTLCYRGLGTPLWVATAAGFWVSFFVNFGVQRRFTFAGTKHAVASSLWRYGGLLAVNTVANIVVVGAFERAGIGFAVGKVVVTVAQTVWNYLAYRYWVFAAPVAVATAAATPQRPEL